MTPSALTSSVLAWFDLQGLTGLFRFTAQVEIAAQHNVPGRLFRLDPGGDEDRPIGNQRPGTTVHIDTD